MARSGGHWSRPAAWRTLCALQRLGWRGTTWEIARITRSVAQHQDNYSVRCWLQWCAGMPERETHRAYVTEELGANEEGRQVVQYSVREDVRDLVRRLRAREYTGTAGEDDLVARSWREVRRAHAGTRRAGGQVLLFETALPAWQRPH